ncbi:MAG: hypothetical protein IKF64_04375 [Eubacterium sp.]|nr:hypothetical protein [Eubacterium sp.]
MGDVEYQRYDINKWDLEREGNVLTITDLDGNEDEYVCTYIRNDNDDYVAFVNENGDEILVDEFTTRDNQSSDNEWQVGETYELELYYKGQMCTIPVTVVESPVESISINPDCVINLLENCGGWEENDENGSFFRYDEREEYIRASQPELTVNYTDGSEVTYRFDGNWNLQDENGNEVENRYLWLEFEQWENHFAPGAENEAYLVYYGQACPITVNVIAENGFNSVDEGEIELGEAKPMLFYRNEKHTVTFTPENDGYYILCNSLGDRLRENNDFDYAFKQGNTELDNIAEDNGDITFYLEGGVTYTLECNVNHGSNDPRFEYLEIRSSVRVADFEYTSCDGNAVDVTEGNYGGEGDIYREGSRITVTFTDGTVETFTATDYGEFINADGQRFDDFARDLGLDGDTRIHAEASTQSWVYGDVNAHLTINVCGVEKDYPVNISASSVDSIDYHFDRPFSFVYEYDLEYRDYENRTQFNGEPFRYSDYVIVNYKDGRGRVRYNHRGGNEFENENDGGDKIYLDYYYNDEGEIKIGDSVEFTISYQNGKNTFNVPVVTTDVQSIEFNPTEFQLYADSDGEWQTNRYFDGQQEVEDNFYEYYEPEIFNYGNSITVTYKDSSTVTYTYKHGTFVDENDNELETYYLSRFSDQWQQHWSVGDDNTMYINYKGATVPVTVNITERPTWSLWERACDSRGRTYENGDTLYIEKGKPIFVYFETDDRNVRNNVSPFVGFSEGYDGGTLSGAGFRIETGEAEWFGYEIKDAFGFVLDTNGLNVGTEATLYYHLYQGNENTDWGDFDFVETPHALDQSLRVVVTDHMWETEVTAPTCNTAGYTTYTCSLCGETYTGNYTSATDAHSFTSEVVEPTCTSSGYTEYTCDACGYVFRDSFTPLRAHDYTATETPATPNTRGYTTYSCNNCEYSYVSDFTAYASDDGALVAVVNKSASLMEEDYSPETFSAFETALAESEGIESGENPQVEIDNAVGKILSSITDLKAYLNLTVSGENGTVTQSAEGPLLQGSSVTVTAAPDSGYSFAGWYEKNTKRIFSNDTEYTFVITSNTALEALFVPSGENSLVFTNKTGQLVKTVSKTPSEWAEEASVDALAPAVPYSYGCTNGVWVIPSDALTRLAQGETVIITPEYDETYAFVPMATATDNTPALNLYYTFDSSNNVGSFVMAVDIPSGCTVESMGTAFYYKKASAFNPNDFILTVNNKTATSKFDDLVSGVYVTNINKLTDYYNWSARGYITYYDGDSLKTAYSNQINIVNREQA